MVEKNHWHGISQQNVSYRLHFRLRHIVYSTWERYMSICRIEPVIIGIMYRSLSKNQDYLSALLDTTEEASVIGNDVLEDRNYSYIHRDTWNPIHMMGQVVILNDSDYQGTDVCREDFIYYTGRVPTTMPEKHIKAR